jgi:hypothetical protein
MGIVTDMSCNQISMVKHNSLVYPGLELIGVLSVSVSTYGHHREARPVAIT